MDPARLARGRSYARSGQVLSLEAGPGGVVAQVQGSRPTPYRVSIKFGKLSAEAWERVVAAMAEEAIYTARLLSGEMPEDIETLFTTVGSSLFPVDQGDMQTHCSCPDWANPCKHVAAVHYLLGERFDDNPFLMFELRGRSQAAIVDALRTLRAGPGADDGPADPSAEAPMSSNPTSFWLPPARGGEIALKFSLPEADALVVKRLGPAPFARDQKAFLTTMEQMYRGISEHALLLALDDTASIPEPE